MDRVLQALADPTRRQILDLLVQQEMSAGDIAGHFKEMSRPAVSQHLAVLKEAGLVHQEKKGRFQVYRIEPHPLKDFWENWLSKYEIFWHDRLHALKLAVEEDKRQFQAMEKNSKEDN